MHTHPISNKKIALLIIVLAATLSCTEILGKNAQTHAINHNVEAANYWNFFQAKTQRKLELITSAQTLEALAADAPQAQKTARAMREEAARYESEPATGEGRQELKARAEEAEKLQKQAYSAYQLYEFATAAFEIAIVLASTASLTEIIFLAYFAGGAGLLGLAFMLLGLVHPALLVS